MVAPHVDFPKDRIAELCRQYRVKELSVFGSVLRDDFRPGSDVDVLVEFEADAHIGLIEYSCLQYDLAELLGRKVDLVEKAGLKHLVRRTVLASARVIYAKRNIACDIKVVPEAQRAGF